MLATLLVALVAIIHLAILVLEMFLWEAPAGRRAFNLSADFARQTRVLAAGIFGALTASRKILYIQALPALLALVAVLTQA